MNKIRRQSGVLVFLTPFLMVALAVVAVLAMDAARLYSVKADMQRVVNAAATAAADSSQACSMDADFSEMKSRALTAAKAVGFSGDESELEVFSGILVPSDEDSAVLEFEKRVDIQQTNAAVVRYTREEPISKLLPSSFFDPVSLSVNAASRKELYAVMSASSSTAMVSNGLLGNLLDAVLVGSGTSIDPTDLESLEGALLSVGKLLDEVTGVSSVTALLDQPLITALDGIVDASGGALSEIGGVVDRITNVAGVENLKLKDVLHVSGDQDAARSASFPLYDFVISVVMNSASQLSESGLLDIGVDTESIAEAISASSDTETYKYLKENSPVTLAASIKVNEPAPVVIGPARKGSDDQGDLRWVTSIGASDIELALNLDVKLEIAGLSLLNLSVPLAVKAGDGFGEFMGANCARGNENSVEIELGIQRSVVSVGTPEGEGVRLSIVGGELLDLGLDIDVGDGGSPVPVRATRTLHCAGTECETVFADPGWDDPKITVTVSNLSTDGLSWLLGKVLEGLVKGLQAVIDGLVNQVLKVIVFPLLDLLGVGLGSMEVRVYDADQLGHQLIENVEM